MTAVAGTASSCPLDKPAFISARGRCAVSGHGTVLGGVMTAAFSALLAVLRRSVRPLV